jgi:hypothetical protein
MIHLPLTVCPPCEVPLAIQTIQPLFPLDDVCPPCVAAPAVELSDPIVSSLCYCPPPPDPIVPLKNPVPTRRRRVVSCFPQFLKNIVTTKFCEVGPKCR